MTYEIECGHCGFRFTIDDGDLTRSVTCAVCGGTLTVAVPVPVASGAVLPVTPVFRSPVPDPVDPSAGPAPPVPPDPEFRPTFFPPLAPDRPDLDDLEPEERGRHLLPPWPTVRTALDGSRICTELGGMIFVCVLSVDLLLMPFVPPKDMTSVGRFLALSAGALLLPAFVNTVCQVCCAYVPRAYGAPRAAAGLVVLLLALFAYVQLLPVSAALAVTLAAGLVVVSFGVWLTFLAQLARRLDDRDMKTEVWSYTSWFCAGTVVSFGLLGFAALGERVGAVPFTWFLKAVTGVIGVRLLWGYAALLRTTVRAIDCRGPVVPRP